MSLFKAILNTIPRPILITASYWARPIIAWWLKGDNFTAPIDGLYSFGYSMRKQTGSYGDFWTYVQKNGSPLNGSGNAPGRVYVDGGSSGASVFASQRFILDLSTGDTVGVIIATTSSIDARISNSYNYFHGYYIGTGNGSFGSYSY